MKSAKKRRHIAVGVGVIERKAGRAFVVTVVRRVTAAAPPATGVATPATPEKVSPWQPDGEGRAF